jgi:predicted permease
MNPAALLFPDLALIALGWLLARHVRLPAGFWDGAESLVYFVLFPALLFGSIARASLSAGQAAPLVATAYGALAVGVVLAYAARRLLRPDGLRFASCAQCGFRFNSYITLSLAARIGEAPGLALAALIVGFIVPLANTAAVWPLARHGGGSVWRALVRNPLVLATVGGLLAQAVGLRMPEPVDATLQRLGQAALGLGLLCVGASLRPAGAAGGDPTRARDTRRLAIWMTATKLLAMPLTALLLARALGLDPLASTIVVMFAAVPTSPAASVLASRLGGDGPLAAFLITVSTLASAATLPLWLALVRGSG